MKYDVVIVGGGPAGQAAALVLGRARVCTLLIDHGTPRSSAAGVMHGFVTRDGSSILDFRSIADEQLRAYPAVSRCRDRVLGIAGVADEFCIQLSSGGSALARRVLLCCGIEDGLPPVPGLPEAWGKGVFGCPYCHGWEVRDNTLGYLTPDAESIAFSWLLQSWSGRVVVLTGGKVALSNSQKAQLEKRRISLEERPLTRIVSGPDGLLRGAELEGGDLLDCQALFLPPATQLPELVRELRLELAEDGSVRVNPDMETSIKGVSAAGDLCNHTHGALAAAASGSLAAHALHRALRTEAA